MSRTSRSAHRGRATPSTGGRRGLQVAAGLFAGIPLATGLAAMLGATKTIARVLNASGEASHVGVAA